MAKVLVIHYDKAIRSALETLARCRHEVLAAKDLVGGIQQMPAFRPDVIVVGHDGRKEEGIRLLRYMKQNVLKAPVVVVHSPGAGAIQPLAMKLGARGFMEHPVDPPRFEAVITAALQASLEAEAGPPPITEEEFDTNLSILEGDLNKKMRCFAGRNQVYIQSMILGGAVTKPRICLKCSLRAEFGLNRDVYYEFIRDVCCSDPARCEAVQQFRARETA